MDVEGLEGEKDRDDAAGPCSEEKREDGEGEPPRAAQDPETVERRPEDRTQPEREARSRDRDQESSASDHGREHDRELAAVWQRGQRQRRNRTGRPERSDERRRDCPVEQADDAERAGDSGKARSRDARTYQPNLGGLAPAGGKEPVECHSGRVRAHDREDRDRPAAGAGQDVAPGDRPQDERRELEGEGGNEEPRVQLLNALNDRRERATEDRRCHVRASASEEAGVAAVAMRQLSTPFVRGRIP